jgi:hypothetical protein
LPRISTNFINSTNNLITISEIGGNSWLIHKFKNMKYTLIVLLFTISLNTSAQTGSGSVEQTLIFQLADKNGESLDLKTIKKKQIKVKINDINNLIYKGLTVNGDFVIIKEGTRYYGDANEINPSEVELIYEYGNEKMIVKIKNIQAAYFKIVSIPFKSGNYVIDLQREYDFVKKMVIKPIDWTYSKVIFEEIKKERQ